MLSSLIRKVCYLFLVFVTLKVVVSCSGGDGRSGELNANEPTVGTEAEEPMGEAADKTIEEITGSWRLSRITLADGTEVSTAGNVNVERSAVQMIEFLPQARYRANNATTAIDSGSFRVNEPQQRLYLESDADDVTPTEYTIELVDNELRMKPRQPDVGDDKSYVYHYFRTEEGLGTN